METFFPHMISLRLFQLMSLLIVRKCGLAGGKVNRMRLKS